MGLRFGWEPTRLPFHCSMSGSPTETPLSGHVQALASHFVYAWVMHFTRKLAMS